MKLEALEVIYAYFMLDLLFFYVSSMLNHWSFILSLEMIFLSQELLISIGLFCWNGAVEKMTC